MKTKIKRLCACGCRQVTNPGKKWVIGHNATGRKLSEKTKRKMSIAKQNMTEQTKLKMSLSSLKSHPNDKYCEIWRDEKYKKDLLKDHCENIECKGDYKRLGNHHINLNKKDCRPCNIITLCVSCHSSLHWKLGRKKDHKNYLTIIRKDRIVYIHKKTRKKIIIRRIL